MTQQSQSSDNDSSTANLRITALSKMLSPLEKLLFISPESNDEEIVDAGTEKAIIVEDLSSEEENTSHTTAEAN